MQCNTWFKRDSKGKIKRRNIVPYYTEREFHNDIEGMELCDGEIVATVRAIEEPCFGGTLASFDIEYHCSKCGNSYFGELPNTEEELSQFLTSMIAKLSQTEREVFISNRLGIADLNRQFTEAASVMSGRGQEFYHLKSKVAKAQKEVFILPKEDEE